MSATFDITEERHLKIMAHCQSIQHLIMDFEALLQAEYHKFWSHVVYDDDFRLALRTYLRMAPRWFDPPMYLSSLAYDALCEELHNVAFKVILRMSTRSESRSDHMSPEVFAEFLDKYIFEPAMILDICTLYGLNFVQPKLRLLTDLLRNYHKYQPKMLEDLGKAAESFSATIGTLKDLCSSSCDIEVTTIAMCVAAMSLKTVDDEQLMTTCLSATETAASLLLLVKNAPPTLLLKFSETIASMPDFFESVFLPLNEEVERRQDSLVAIFKDNLKTLLRRGMKCALDVYRHYVEQECTGKLTDSLSDADAVPLLEKYYATLMQAVPEKSFMLAYNSLYPLEEDFEELRRNRATREFMDESHLKYILESLNQPIPETAVLDENVYGRTVEYAGASCVEGAVGGVSDEVNSVLAIFPDLRQEFVEKCLEFYGGNVDEVVSAIMDNNTHPELEKFKVSAAPPNSPSVVKKTTFDGAEVHIGKKNKVSKDLLDDRTEKFNLRKIVLQYTDVVDEVVVQPTDKLYDDEYDDTYDSNDIGIPEKTTGDCGRAFEEPRILAGRGDRRKKHWEQDEAESDMDEETARRKRMDFCENPEEARARREQRYQDRMAARGRAPPQQRDVVGGARGQGQSGDVLRNRALKERNKGGNRRAQADRKRREF
ncbi:activating signal cointegrator 1 complex subunit 2 [Galendromus occidentalis]|uniref:Activating signal cointegrator 1 complex subunit 2 n=1 Tax=Galendromus occidentalis TaxID=34638 RepID=A0AAJ6QPA7_9ACAR|nr:activating signal cointegrator 1 complex subunit 2 [Galendromus occidentalis]